VEPQRDTRIDRLLETGKTISFEFFPPKTEAGYVQLFQAIDALHPLKPSFVSVTYGAGAAPGKKPSHWLNASNASWAFRAMAHLTCTGHTTRKSRRSWPICTAGIRNVLALRGDPPAGQTQFVPVERGSSTPALVRIVTARGDLCIGVAGYPEGHPQCLNRTRDLEMLKLKVDNGACFVVTQLFFDNADFYRFRDEARAMGIKRRLSRDYADRGVAQIKRFVGMSGRRFRMRCC